MNRFEELKQKFIADMQKSTWWTNGQIDDKLTTLLETWDASKPQLRTDADWQELLTLRSENATLKEMVAKHGGRCKWRESISTKGYIVPSCCTCAIIDSDMMKLNYIYCPYCGKLIERI